MVCLLKGIGSLRWYNFLHSIHMIGWRWRVGCADIAFRCPEMPFPTFLTQLSHRPFHIAIIQQYHRFTTNRAIP